MAITLGSGTTTPAPAKQTLASNYVDFTATATAGWAQQYLPELYEAEVEKYGNRSVGGFLSMVGAEMPMSSDQVVWSEQGRLHLSYSGGTCGADTSGANTISGLTDHAIRVGQLVLIHDGIDAAKAQVTAVPSTSSITVKGYGGANGLIADSSISNNSGVIKLFVFGSEFKKAQSGMSEAVTPSFQSYTNNPIIMKDKYEISGSDAAQIGWVEVTGESGQGGFLWYLKAEGDTRQRFNDYLEMTMVEIETNSNTTLSGIKGSEG
jgi:hypothetical protein